MSLFRPVPVSQQARRATFVVFEGIDGSGKTTLSNLVAEHLRQAGLRVTHVRSGGHMASAVAERIRLLARDPRNLALSPEAELLLYAARETQQLDEAILPALDTCDVVISDRFLYTAESLAVHGRGLPASVVQPVIAAAARGVQPDLVLLIDVDPALARARRRADKIARPGQRTSSRKGLSGAGLMQRLRNGYRDMAERDPERWVVVDNADSDLHALAALLTRAVQDAIMGGVAAVRDCMAKARTQRLISPQRPASPAGTGITAESARRALLARIDAVATREPEVAAYLLGGLCGDGFDERRFGLMDAAPAIVAAGLRGLDDAASWELRACLVDAERAPAWVARSLTGLSSADERTWALRQRLWRVVPADVAASLEGLLGERAWELRERLWGLVPEAVLASLQGDDSARAWELRERWLDRGGIGRHMLDEPERARAACASVRGLGDARAWAIRERSREIAPVSALTSIAGLSDERSWAWRYHALERAPRPVMRTIAGSTDDRAWAMREQVVGRSKEALDSITGMDGARAWALRERAARLWPSTVVKSLGPLGYGERGRALIERQLREFPHELSLLRHAAGFAAEPVLRSAAVL